MPASTGTVGTLIDTVDTVQDILPLHTTNSPHDIPCHSHTLLYHFHTTYIPPTYHPHTTHIPPTYHLHTTDIPPTYHSQFPYHSPPAHISFTLNTGQISDNISVLFHGSHYPFRHVTFLNVKSCAEEETLTVYQGLAPVDEVLLRSNGRLALLAAVDVVTARVDYEELAHCG